MRKVAIAFVCLAILGCKVRTEVEVESRPEVVKIKEGEEIILFDREKARFLDAKANVLTYCLLQEESKIAYAGASGPYAVFRVLSTTKETLGDCAVGQHVVFDHDFARTLYVQELQRRDDEANMAELKKFVESR